MVKKTTKKVIKKKTNVRVTKKTSKKSSKEKQKLMLKKFYSDYSVKIGIAIIVIAVIAGAMLLPKSSSSGATGEVVLDMYVMSQCPYGVQAENEAIKAVERFGSDVDYNIYFIVDSQGDSFRSLHGQAEVDEDMRQVCIQNLYSNQFLDYLTCFNSDYKNAPQSHAKCSGELGFDTNAIQSCVKDKGIELLKASEVKTKEIGATGSPTIYLDGESYGSGRSELDFARAICDKFDYNNEGCSDIPKPVALNIIVITDDSCPSCSTDNIIGVSKQLFPGAKFEKVDIDSEKGKELADKYQLIYLPAYIFESKVTETNTWKTNKQIQGAFVQSGDSFRLRDEATGANWFINKEKQAEFFASIGITKGDNKPEIDFFVMSYCPYGNQAEEAIAPVYEQLKDKAIFKPKYVIYSNYGSGYPDYCLDEQETICSMHGIQEVHQDIREKCVEKYNGMDDWFSFALAMNNQCNAQNADTCWKGVAESLGLDTNAISTCEADEGSDLLLADKTLGNKLGVRGSPSVFIDGVAHAGARTANGFLTSLCAGFEDAPEECANVVTEPTQTTVPSGACG